MPQHAPSPKQLEQYEREGYFMYRGLFAEAELAEVRRYILDHVVEQQRLPEIQPHVTDRFLRDWCRQDRLLDLVEPLLGPDIALWTVHCFHKPARVGKRTPWHQDAPYWEMAPVVTASIWLALEPVDRENGCMMVMPGTHGRQASHHAIDVEKEHAALGLEVDEMVDESKAVAIELAPGDCSVHHSHLVHGAAANVSGRTRNGLVMRYMPTTSIRRAGDMALARGVDRSGGQSVYIDES